MSAGDNMEKVITAIILAVLMLVGVVSVGLGALIGFAITSLL